MLKGDLKWKIPLILILVVVSAWYLIPIKQALNLGLDLQGGLHLILEIQTAKVVENELVRVKDQLSREFKKERLKVASITLNEAQDLVITASSPADLTKITEYVDQELPNFEKKGLIGSATSVTIGIKEQVATMWQDNAMTQALITMRNRIDQYGVAEPIIQRQGKDRVIVELPGVQDLERALALIGKTAELRFQLVVDMAATKEELLTRYENKLPDGTEILAGNAEGTSSGSMGAYLVEKEAKVTGANLQDARTSKDEMGMGAVSFEFDRIGAKEFGRLTEQNINKALAIVLDGVVQSAPVIRSRITTQGQITGNFTQEEANDLAIVLRAGALPAPVKILENISVGPSLGEDSIHSGSVAIMIGCLAVVVFMLVYYKFSGLIADAALLLNLFFIFGTLAYFKATLTLPGLAGIALTLGMAVDSNVLIYERIKEELRRGKTLRSAVENGFDRAHVTIIDANLTTLLAGIILFQFGTGPVKGFAVTLSIGIVTTLFSALIVSKVIFDLLLQSGKVKRLSI